MDTLKLTKTYLGLGSNQGKRGENLKEAMLNLERWGVKILRASSIYETEPVGLANQPWFYNMAVWAETGLSPEELLKAVSLIELAMGRQRGAIGGQIPVVNGPRPIDIDILFYGDEVVEMPGLNIPHPRIEMRNFVLVPMAELAPELVHPLKKMSIKELLNGCGDKAIVRPIS